MHINLLQRLLVVAIVIRIDVKLIYDTIAVTSEKSTQGNFNFIAIMFG